MLFHLFHFPLFNFFSLTWNKATPLKRVSHSLGVDVGLVPKRKEKPVQASQQTSKVPWAAIGSRPLLVRSNWETLYPSFSSPFHLCRRSVPLFHLYLVSMSLKDVVWSSSRIQGRLPTRTPPKDKWWTLSKLGHSAEIVSLTFHSPMLLKSKLIYFGVELKLVAGLEESSGEPLMYDTVAGGNCSKGGRNQDRFGR